MNFSAFGKIGKLILGMSVAGSLAAGVTIKPWEGRVYTVYLDPIGIPTVCDGITGDAVISGKTYTDQECDMLLAHEVNEHEKGLDECLTSPQTIPTETKAAMISWTFNVGVGAACRSTLVRKANAGDLVGACNELSRWVYAGGRKFRGLENRRFRGDNWRISERTLCMKGIDPEFEAPLYEQWMRNYKDWKSGYTDA